VREIVSTAAPYMVLRREDQNYMGGSVQRLGDTSPSYGHVLYKGFALSS